MQIEHLFLIKIVGIRSEEFGNLFYNFFSETLARRLSFLSSMHVSGRGICYHTNILVVWHACIDWINGPSGVRLLVVSVGLTDRDTNVGMMDSHRIFVSLSSLFH